MKSWKTAGGLVLVLLILSGIAYWDEQKTKRDEEEEKTKNKLFSLRPESATKILYRSMEDGEEVKVELERKDTKSPWMIKSPVVGKADESTVSNLLSNVLDFKHEKVVAESKGRWPDFGLDNPTRIIRIEGSGDEFASLHLGAKSPVGYSVYARIGDAEQTYLGSQHILMSTSKTLRDFRDKSLIEGLIANEVVQIRYKMRNDPEIRLEKSDGAFKIKSPITADADQDEAKDLIESIAGQKVEGFVDNPEKALIDSFGEGKRWAELEWVTESGERTKLLMSDFNGKFWMSFDPNKLAYELSESDKAKYEKSVMKLRDRRIFEFDSDEIARVELDGTVYKNVKGEFFPENQEGGKKNKGSKKSNPEGKIRTLVEDLEFAKTQQFLAKTEVKEVLERAPKHRIKLWHSPKESKEEREIVVDVFPEESAHTAYLSKNGSDIIYVVPERVFSSLNPDKEISDEGSDSAQALEPLDLDSLSN